MKLIQIPAIVERMIDNPGNNLHRRRIKQLPGWLAVAHFMAHVGDIPGDVEELPDEAGRAAVEMLAAKRTPLGLPHPKIMAAFSEAFGDEGRAVMASEDHVFSLLAGRLSELLDGLWPVRLGDVFNSPVGGVDDDGDVVVVVMPLNEQVTMMDMNKAAKA